MKKTKIIRYSLLIAAIILFITASTLAYNYYSATKVDTNTLLETALNNLSHRETYRFSLNSQLQLNNYNKAETAIAGERDASKNIHIWGEIMNTKLEMYQFANEQYRYNSAAKQWILLENSSLTNDPLLLMEILPETNFLFKSNSKEVYEGKNFDHGKIIHKYKINIQNTQHIAGDYYDDFQYTIYIDARSKEIIMASIAAKAKNNENNILKISLKFYDINEEFSILPPQ